ncbi:MAG: UTP--glucose-1-phosphate uridylyltransferase [Caldimicrobium sp.]
MPKKAVLPVAGFGTRMLPITKVIPKELLPIFNRPVIEYVVDEIILSGFENLIFVISYGKEAILDYFDIDIGLRSFLEERKKDKLLKIVEEVEEKIRYLSSIRQKIPQGLGHAVLMAENLVGEEPFAVVLGDDVVDASVPCLKQMVQAYLKLSAQYKNHSVIALEKVALEDVSKYGIVDGERLSDNLLLIKKVVEKPTPEEAPSNLSIVGRYIFDPIIFEYLKKIPKTSGEYQLTDAIELMINDGYPVIGYLFEGQRLDTGNPQGFFKALLHYATKDPSYLQIIKDYCKAVS